MSDHIKCDKCGRFIAHDAIDFESEYTPSSEFTEEKIELTCSRCVQLALEIE